MLGKLNPHRQYRHSTQSLPLASLVRLRGVSGWLRGGGPQARPAPGRRLARPARLRGLGPAWPWRPALRGLGRQVSLPSFPAPRLGAQQAAAAWFGSASAQPQPRLPVPIHPGNRPALLHSPGLPPPGRGRRSAPGERHPGATQSPKLFFFLNLFSCPTQKLL